MEENLLLFLTIDEILKIETSKMGLLPKEKYVSPPFLRIRFKDVQPDSKIYMQLQTVVREFVGKLKWDFYKPNEGINYVLTPVYFKTYINGLSLKQAVQESSGDEIRQNVDLSIDDIVPLASHIKANFRPR